MDSWYQIKINDVLQKLSVDRAEGLSNEEAEKRRSNFGPNELVEKGAKNPWAILWDQLTATMVVILIVAAVISGLLGDLKDAVAITAIVLLNAIMGFIQEYKAEKAMAALKKMAVPRVRVRRGGQILEISSRDLVPGDIVILEAGNFVPADGRLISAVNLRIQESALTGESESVEKDESVPGGTDLPLGDRRNMAYMGTNVNYGRGEVVITETGMKTELGKIASLLQSARHDPTPLQKRLDGLGKQLAWIALGIVAVVFVLGLLRGEDFRDMFFTAVSLAVAAVPEGLPAVVTIALAFGSQRMLKRRALIRKLPAVETLGSVMVICSDKTGTLTENRMTVTALCVAGHQVECEYVENMKPKTHQELKDHPALTLLLTGSVLCNDAVLERVDGELKMIGDPTEGALLAVAGKQGLEKKDLEKILPRMAEVPFDSHRKRMTTVHQIQPGPKPEWMDAKHWDQWMGNGPYLAFTKGSVDGLAGISSHVWNDDHPEPMSDVWRDRIITANQDMAKNGMRVLSVAFRPLKASDHSDPASLEKDLIFIGLVAMIDPPRAEVKAAVKKCQSAGIRTVMITGDHPLTAQYIAAQLGMTSSGDRTMIGQELERLTAQELENSVEEVSVYARVSPEHKLKIIQAFQNKGIIVAMTGDGVNDAPALKKADIGVAMGITGTDVSKEAADMVLIDDNFATIVAAVEEGRIIYDNIRKFIKYLLTTNSAEVLIMLIAPFLGMPLPLLPLQILWINLVSDGPTALTLAVEPAERNIMQRPPHNPQDSLFARGLGIHAVWVGLLMTFIALGVGFWYFHSGQQSWQTMLFTVLAMSQMGHVVAVRSERDSLWAKGLFTNKWLFQTVLGTLLLQVAVIYVPFFQSLLKTTALSLQDLMICFGLGAVVFTCVEIEKWFKRRKFHPSM